MDDKFETDAGFKDGKYVKAGSVRPTSLREGAKPESGHLAEVSEDMTKAELEAEAERRGVELPSGATKADIVALLNG